MQAGKFLYILIVIFEENASTSFCAYCLFSWGFFQKAFLEQ